MKARSRINVPVEAQLQPPEAHHKKRMRKRGLYVGIVALLLLLVISGGAGKIRDSLVFYARVARLYTQTPDARLAMPVQDISKRHIADTWGAPRGTNRRHEGQDIFAPKGSPILSATSGYVYNIGENNLGGQTVSVIGRGGRVYYYAHLDSYAPALREGDYVTTKTVLGYVGTTGNAQGTPPHLHFGVYATGGAINPLPLLSDRTSTSATHKPKTKPKPVNRKV
jgi:peptidoglycan LD-endopeptidase LytH